MLAAIRKAEEYARKNANMQGEVDDSYLYPPLGKFPDARDTATRMGPNMDNVTSQFGKHRIILEEGAEAARILRTINMPYNRLWGGMNFLYTGLVHEIDRLERHYRDGSGAQSSLEDPLGIILHMQELMKTFQPTKGLKPAGPIARKFEAIRAQGINALL